MARVDDAVHEGVEVSTLHSFSKLAVGQRFNPKNDTDPPQIGFQLRQ